MRLGLSPRKILIAMPVVILVTIVILCLISGVVGERVPTFAKVRGAHRPSDVWLVDRNGQPIESLRIVKTHRSLEWVAYDEISPAFIETLVRAEDRRFFEHRGVDPIALISATRSAVVYGNVRGASTITMQLAKNLDSKIRSSRNRIGYKLRQVVRAIEIDLGWSKQEIIEAYVNRVSFRGEVSGLQAASFGFFQKSPRALNQIESAFLVALLRSPNASIEKIQRRAEGLAGFGGRDSVAELAVRQLAKEVLSRPLSLMRERSLVPVISKRFVEKGEGTTVIQTSLDLRIQRLAVQAVEEQLRSLKKQNVSDAALVVLETATGRPVAYVANGGPLQSSAVQVDGVESRRQLGSTIKAFVYGTAYDQNLITTTSLLHDSPENVAVGSGQVYQPRNYDYLFRGEVGAAEALGSSLNVPAVRVLSLVGEGSVVEKLKALGFQNLKDEDQYGPSLALGTVDATLWELAQGYRQLSVYSDTNVFSIEAKLKIFESLSIAENRRFTFGVESLLQLPFAAAAKTGTSKDMRDNWCVGFTSEYTVAAWVGNFNGDPMWNVSGISGAAPLWRQVMLALHRDNPPKDKLLNYQSPDAPLRKRTLSKIRYPVSEMLIGLDPDIPKKLQLVPLRVEGRRAGLRFFVNNRLVGRASSDPFWTPVKGRQHLELRDAQGIAIDQIEFVVR